MEREKNFLYSSKKTLIFILWVSVLASLASFYLDLDFNKADVNWNVRNEIESAVSSSLYNDYSFENNIFKYYIRSEKLIKLSNSSNSNYETEDYYDDFSVLDASENFVIIKADSDTVIKFKKLADGKYVAEETVFIEDVKKITERPSNFTEFYHYYPGNIEKAEETTLVENYLTNDDVFLSRYGYDFKFNPPTMEINKNYVYARGHYDGSKVRFNLSENKDLDKYGRMAYMALGKAIDNVYSHIDPANGIKDLDFVYTVNVNSDEFRNFVDSEIVVEKLMPKIVLFSLLAFAIFFVVALLASYDKLGDVVLYKRLSAMPIELWAMILTATGSVAALVVDKIIRTYGGFASSILMNSNKFMALAILAQIISIFVFGLATYYFVYIFKDLFRKGFKGDLFKNSIILRIFGFIVSKIKSGIYDFTNNLEGTKKKTVLLVYGVLLLIGFIGSNLFCSPGNGGFVFFLWIILITGMFAFLRIYYNDILELEKASEFIAKGDYSKKLDEGKTRFKTIAHNLNTVSSNLDLAVEKAVKSERMKTELITNVSHDLKTPLTSIINYSELITKEGLTDEELKEYTWIINDKSHKLKNLIENLFEVSKLNSNNIELHMENLNFSQLVDQVIGEWEDKLGEKGLKVMFSCPEEPVILALDGNQTYRVLENLFSNIYKYALENTRIYVDVIESDKVELVIKNISKYPLNISPYELLERFTRGDASRNTEGSGLGLSIASSLTEIQAGEFNLEIDGDLFKVIIRF